MVTKIEIMLQYILLNWQYLKLGKLTIDFIFYLHIY